MKILIAGLGSIGQRHVRNLRRLRGDGIELIAYRHRGLPHVITEQMTLDASVGVEERYGIRSFSNLDDALAERPVATIVSNPTRWHLPTAIAAVRAGSHVLIEKPLSHDMAGVDDLVGCAERRGLIAAVGYQMRFHPALIRLRQLLADDRIGAVRSVSAEWNEYLPDAHPYEDYRQSYAARADLGGGVILCFIHELDYLIWLFGMPRTVSATGGRSGELDVDVEDWAMTSMVVARETGDIAVELRQSFTQREPSRTCVVNGEQGSITVDLRAPSIEIRSREVVERETFDHFDRNTLFLDEMSSFLSSFETGRVAVPAHEAAGSLRVALAAKRSIASGQPVDIA